MSRYGLDLSPLDLELLWSFVHHVFKLCVKFEQNRTIHCRVVDDLARYHREICQRVTFTRKLSEGCVDESLPNLEKTYVHHLCSQIVTLILWVAPVTNLFVKCHLNLHIDITLHYTDFVSELRYLAAFSNVVRSKMSDVEQEANFRTF